jgi:hypothetical protein
VRVSEDATILIDFLIYLNNKKLINNYDFDYEFEAIKFLNINKNKNEKEDN